jgi:tubulin monoglycylase TTLL15
MLVRFCPEPYHPFNASNVEQYVIYETHTSINDLPSFKKNSEKFGFSSKMMFEDYLRENGHDVNELWRKVDEIITTIIKRNEAYLVQEVWGKNQKIS